jgi:hypothetical protein
MTKVWAAGISLMGLLALLVATVMLGGGEARAACGTALPTAKGTATFAANVPAAGTYRVWVRMLAPSTNVNGFYMQIVDASVCGVTMGDAVIPVNTWTWVDYQNGTSGSKVNATLTSGNHVVQLAGMDDGVRIDKVLLLSDGACIPAGDGANCMKSAVSTSPTPKAAVAKGIQNASCKLDGKPIDCNAVDSSKLADGQHELVVTGVDGSGRPVEKKTTVTVDNKRSASRSIVAAWAMYGWRIGLGVVGVVVIVLIVWWLRRRRRLMNLGEDEIRTNIM